jgi:hypothetical protein
VIEFSKEFPNTQQGQKMYNVDAGKAIDTFLRITEVVDSGSSGDYIDFIKAASLAIHEIIQTETSREEFARRYGENMLQQLLGP